MEVFVELEVNNTQNTDLSCNDGSILLGEVRCPNLCFNGLEKVHDNYKALYDFCKCKYCNGRGFVKFEDYEQINSKI